MSKKKLPVVFLGGLLCGLAIPILAAVAWIGGGVSLQEHGEVLVERFPSGINTITVQNDIVQVSSTNLSAYRNVPLEVNLIVNCRDKSLGSIYGIPWHEKFFFYYENELDSKNKSLPLNDIRGVHPETRLRNGEQGAAPQIRPR